MNLPRALPLLILMPWLGGCFPPQPPLPPVPPAVAGFAFDAFRERRLAQDRPELWAGAAKVKITPNTPRVRLAGHGLYHRRAEGILDDLYARVLVMDGGEDAVVLVSLDVIGWTHPRLERIRARVSARYQDRILVAATHNHAGPDTLGLWGSSLLGLLPLRSGIDRTYLEWVERQVALAIEEAVRAARPARLWVGRFPIPPGFAANLREPEDLPREAQVLRATTPDGATIGTLIEVAIHAEALQDKNRYLSADYPGVLCREADRLLGGVTLFVSGPAGGMIEPANDPADPARRRIAFRNRLGAALAQGAARLVRGGLQELARPRLRVFSQRLELPVDAHGLIDLALRLHLLEPRPIEAGRVTTEMALVDLGVFRLLTVPGEPTPEAGRVLAGLLEAPQVMIVALGLDELAYILTDRQWLDARFEYERSMSLGPETFGRLREAAAALVRRAQEP